jgi:hypothetical protein
MAKLFLDAIDTFTVSNDVEVFGAAGGNEVVKISGTPNVQLNGDVERIELSDNAADYTYLVTGTQITILKDGTAVATLSGLNQVAKVAFADGSADLELTGLNAVTLGGTALPTGTAAAVVPATIDAGDTSTGGGNTGGQTFVLTEGLTTLSAAEDAKAAFLLAAAQDPDVDGEETALTEAQVAGNETTALATVDGIVTGYTAASTGVRAALLADEQPSQNTALTTAQTAVTEAQTAINAVAGLSAAVTAYEAAVDANTAAAALVAGDGSLTADLAAALANFNTLNGTAATLDADGTDNADTYIEVNGDSDGAGCWYHRNH